MRPIVGQTVQYTTGDGRVRAAIVAEVQDDSADLVVIAGSVAGGPPWVYAPATQYAPVAGMKGSEGKWSPIPVTSPPSEPARVKR